MLYTVVPLERIYANPRSNETSKKKDLNKQSEALEEAEYRDIQLRHGRVIARRDGDNYVVEKINSTDMSDYLNEEYAPGKSIE